MARSSPDWDLDSDEIASVTSQDLHDNRPNRWTGERATWRYITAEERRLWRSMKMLEDRDLALHLYNAHALKRRGRDPETAQDVTVTMDNGLQGIWAPPKVWTAWPMNEKRVPDEGLNGGQADHPDDADEGEERSIFRLRETKFPSSELQEELSATILRMAKERFYREKRLSEMTQAGKSDVEGEEATSDEETASSIGSDEMEVEKEDDDSQAMKAHAQEGPATFEPVPSADDELSYRLVKLPVRHILTQLDATLKVLHNARAAAADYASDSSATSDDSDSQMSEVKRSRGRPRAKRSDDRATDDDIAATSSQPEAARTVSSRSRRGRPKKIHLPREGESHEDMLVRIARESHRRLPPPSVAIDKDAAFEDWLRTGDQKMTLLEQEMMRREKEKEEEEEEQLGIEPGASAQERRLRRLGLRDWSDVVGAAALAGFSAEVIARTTRRCAALFGEGMTIRRLEEVPSTSRQQSAFQSVDYHPEPIHLGSEDEDYYYYDDDADDESNLSLAPSSRQPSAEPRRSRGRTTASPSPRSHSDSRSRSASHSRSLSRSSAGCHLCPVHSCERAMSGFSRKQNLKRHMRLVHPGRDEDEEERDSEDEVLGAVHVDGFLKPIVPARGWRDMQMPLSRKRDWDQHARDVGPDKKRFSSPSLL